MENIYNLFKFIENKYPQYRAPIKFKLVNNIPLTKEDLNVKGHLDLSKSDITTLPDGLKVSGHLYLDGCKRLTSLPIGLEVGWSLRLNNCTSLESLPSDLEVYGNFFLINTPISEKYTEEQIRKMCPGIKGGIFL